MIEPGNADGAVKSVFLFPNGMFAVCDHRGQQIPDLQGLDTPELRQAILEHTDYRTEWHGISPPKTLGYGTSRLS